VLRIATYLENPALPAAAALGMLFPGALRVMDVIYDLVAANRYQFLGMRDECRVGDARYDDRFLM
jgi:predicted DCC family thiol-disulfide oxidoreductase YuxK